MAHSLIFGMTESGKTTFAKRLSHEYFSSGQLIIVLDPLNDPEWAADFKTTRVDEFLRVYWANRSCFAFIDEAGDSVGRFDEAMIQTATRGRHWGHSNHYISQRGAQLSRTLRDQCSHLFLFATALEDCKTHAREWNKPELLDAPNLQQGEYLHATRFKPVQRGGSVAKVVPENEKP